MDLADEPLLDIDDIQGHILVGFRGAFQDIVGLRLDPDAPRPWVTGLLFRMPTAVPVVFDA